LHRLDREEGALVFEAGLASLPRRPKRGGTGHTSKYRNGKVHEEVCFVPWLIEGSIQAGGWLSDI